MKYKYIILVRHGEPENPKKMVYNLDEVMKKEDIIHITDYGKEQLRVLGRVIKKKKFLVTKIRYSNQTRAVESAKALNELLRVKDIKVEAKLKDVYAPGGYLEGMMMDELKKKPGDAYDPDRWSKYHHESPKHVCDRIDKVFQETKSNLNLGETAILLSHGDPIAWWINYQVMDILPNPTMLRSLIYPNQGEGIVVVLDSHNNFIKQFLLKDPELLKGKSY